MEKERLLGGGSRAIEELPHPERDQAIVPTVDDELRDGDALDLGVVVERQPDELFIGARDSGIDRQVFEQGTWRGIRVFRFNVEASRKLP